MLNTSTSVIGRYERDEMTPFIDVAKKITKLLDTTVGYLLREMEQENVFKKLEILKHFNEIESMNEEGRNHILYTQDALIKNVKLKAL